MCLEVEGRVVAGQTPEHWTILLSLSREEAVEVLPGQTGGEHQEAEGEVFGRHDAARSAHG